MIKQIFTAALLATTCASTYAADNKIDTLVVTTTPQMHCESCENKIKKNIRFVKGTKSITTSLPDQTVTIIYNNKKTTYEDFVAAFKEIGFEIKKTEKAK